VDQDVLGLLAVGGVQELVACNVAYESTITSMAAQQEALTSAFLTLSNNFSSLVGMNSGLSTVFA
jgi:hypothetical protein